MNKVYLSAYCKNREREYRTLFAKSIELDLEKLIILKYPPGTWWIFLIAATYLLNLCLRRHIGVCICFVAGCN
jgi:hypothetical protein